MRLLAFLPVGGEGGGLGHGFGTQLVSHTDSRYSCPLLAFPSPPHTPGKAFHAAPCLRLALGQLCLVLGTQT